MELMERSDPKVQSDQQVQPVRLAPPAPKVL